MAYQSNIPLPTDGFSKSQGDINGNFTALAPFGNGYCQLPPQAPAPTFPATNQGIYGFVNPTTGVSETYFHKQTVDAPAEVPGTACKMSNTAIASCDNGWTYTPSGLLLKWGRVDANAGTTVNINPTATSGGPNFNRVFRVMVTPQDSGTATNFNCGQRTAAAAPSGNFSAYIANPNGNTSVVYLVIGV